MWETPNPKSQPSDVFSAAFARRPLGAPARGRSAASWSSAAGGRWQRSSRRPGPPLPAPRAGCQAREAGAKPRSPRERARRRRWRLGSVPRLAGQKGCTCTREGACWKASTASYSQPGGGRVEEMCFFPGLCLHPGARTLCAPLLCLSDSSWPWGAEADGGACELLSLEPKVMLSGPETAPGAPSLTLPGTELFFSLTALVWLPYDFWSVVAVCFPQWHYAFFQIETPFPQIWSHLYSEKKKKLIYKINCGVQWM